MDLVKKHAVWGWLAGLLVLAALFVWRAVSEPSMPGASAAIVSRVGMLSIAAIFPVILGARTIARFTADNTTAALLLPIFLALLLGVLVIIFAFIPEDARLCSGLARYETIERDPACVTSTATRLKLLAEAYVIWLLFGALLYVSFRLRQRKERKALRAARA